MRLAGQDAKTPRFSYRGKTWRLDVIWSKGPDESGENQGVTLRGNLASWRSGWGDGGGARIHVVQVSLYRQNLGNLKVDVRRGVGRGGAWRTFRRSLRIKVKGI